jgi:DNA-binding MarR family transcriptional regulator
MTDQRPIGYWLKLVDRLIDEQFAETLEEHGVTRRQWQLLNVLSRKPSTVEELDTAIAPFLAGGEQAESSAEHLTELIDSGWVDATPSGYEVTERGQTAFDRLSDVVSSQRAHMAEGITEKDYLETVGVLERMALNLGWTAPEE